MSSIDRSHHGGLSRAEADVIQTSLKAGQDIIDLSVNLNPAGPPSGVLAAIQNCDVRNYPEIRAQSLTLAWAAHLGSPPENVLFGNGACELLWTLALHLRSKSGPALVVEPTFSEFARAIQAYGGSVQPMWQDPNQRDPQQHEEIISLARKTQAGSVYLCRPNNPTAWAMPFEALGDIAQALPRTPIVVDESFLSLSVHHQDAKRELPANVYRLRSLTKDYGLAGIRLGYLLASADLITELQCCRPPWTTNACAQAAGHALLEEDEFLRSSRKELLQGTRSLEDGLRQHGLEPLPSHTIFSLVPVSSAKAFRQALLSEGIVVRDASSFGLPQHIRIAAGTRESRRRLMQALDQQAPR